jgi:hypothetical protein
LIGATTYFSTLAHDPRENGSALQSPCLPGGRCADRRPAVATTQRVITPAAAKRLTNDELLEALAVVLRDVVRRADNYADMSEPAALLDGLKFVKQGYDAGLWLLFGGDVPMGVGLKRVQDEILDALANWRDGDDLGG